MLGLPGLGAGRGGLLSHHCHCHYPQLSLATAQSGWSGWQWLWSFPQPWDSRESSCSRAGVSGRREEGLCHGARKGSGDSYLFGVFKKSPKIPIASSAAPVERGRGWEGVQACLQCWCRYQYGTVPDCLCWAIHSVQVLDQAQQALCTA